MNITRTVTCSSLAAVAIAGCLSVAASIPANAAPRSTAVPNDPQPVCTGAAGVQLCIGFVYNGPTLTNVQMDQEVNAATSGITYLLTGPNGWSAKGGPYSSNGPGWLPQLTSPNASGPGTYCAYSYASGQPHEQVCKST